MQTLAEFIIEILVFLFFFLNGKSFAVVWIVMGRLYKLTGFLPSKFLSSYVVTKTSMAVLAKELPRWLGQAIFHENYGLGNFQGNLGQRIFHGSQNFVSLIRFLTYLNSKAKLYLFELIIICTLYIMNYIKKFCLYVCQFSKGLYL